LYFTTDWYNSIEKEELYDFFEGWEIGYDFIYPLSDESGIYSKSCSDYVDSLEIGSNNQIMGDHFIIFEKIITYE
jgi:hypothetical protein